MVAAVLANRETLLAEKIIYPHAVSCYGNWTEKKRNVNIQLVAESLGAMVIPTSQCGLLLVI